MGRYVTGDFDYKFAFAEQNSSFGEVLEEMVGDTDNQLQRFISDDGEIIRLFINDAEGLKKNITEYISDFKEMTPEQEKKWTTFDLKMGQEYWDKFMMKQFLEEANISDDAGTLEIEVEY